MIINLPNTPPAALPPSVKGGGSAPSKQPASGDPFASFIEQLSAGAAGAPGTTPTKGSAGAGRRRGPVGAEAAEGAVSLADEVVDPALVASGVRAWVWAMSDQAKSVVVPLAQTPAGTVRTATIGRAQSDEPTPATDGNVGPLLGAIPALIPDAVGAVPAGPAAEIAPAIQRDPSTPAPASVGASTSASPEQEASPNGASIVVAGSGPVVEPQTNGPANQTPATANRPDGFDPQQPTTAASPDQNGSAPAVLQNHRAGRAPTAYADAARKAPVPVSRASSPK